MIFPTICSYTRQSMFFVWELAHPSSSSIWFNRARIDASLLLKVISNFSCFRLAASHLSMLQDLQETVAFIIVFSLETIIVVFLKLMAYYFVNAIWWQWCASKCIWSSLVGWFELAALISFIKIACHRHPF